MINLSKKAADRFKMKWQSLPERSGDNWKIDIIMIERTPMLLIIHEYTLFTLVRRKSEFKSIPDIAEEIRKCCPWYRYTGEISIGKNNDRRLIGSINEIKFQIEGEFLPNQINAMEMQINDCLYSYLSPRKRDYGKPFEAVEEYSKGLWPEQTLDVS
ncbi:MAG: hypothetical protein HY807_07795 [Nitrospirae bacterium]|nr:hypothetical protein [Nitrospirota bacterium]